MDREAAGRDGDLEVEVRPEREAGGVHLRREAGARPGGAIDLPAPANVRPEESIDP